MQFLLKDGYKVSSVYSELKEVRSELCLQVKQKNQKLLDRRIFQQNKLKLFAKLNIKFYRQNYEC